ncbi:MAG: lipoyl(octanoyl) transferase LipB [Sphingomonadales bacterium]
MAVIEWKVSTGRVPYETALQAMETRVEAIRREEAPELVWLLEHPALYTAGTSAKAEDLIEPNRFPVFDAGRGGEYTYHGPGQRVAYVMLDLQRRGRDLRRFVRDLEQWIIDTLAVFAVRGERRSGRVGVWVERGSRVDDKIVEDKIAAIGVRVRRWVTFHGIALNVEPDLSHYQGIVPCGIPEHGVTSLVDLGLPVTMMDVDAALRRSFEKIFLEGGDRLIDAGDD